MQLDYTLRQLIVMTFLAEPLRKRFVIGAVFTALLCTVTLVAGARIKRARLPVSEARAEGASRWTANSIIPFQSQRTIVDSVFVALTPQGFQPTAITRKSGQLALIINNRTRLREVNIDLKSDNAVRLRSTRVLREKPVIDELINLSPGRYILTEASRPSWRCTITVTPR